MLNVSENKRNMLNKVISSEIKRQEEHTEGEKIAGFVRRLREKEETRFNRMINRINQEREAILVMIENKAQSVGSLNLGLPLKEKYLEMEEANTTTEIRHRWKAVLAGLGRFENEEENA